MVYCTELTVFLIDAQTTGTKYDTLYSLMEYRLQPTTVQHLLQLSLNLQLCLSTRSVIVSSVTECDLQTSFLPTSGSQICVEDVFRLIMNIVNAMIMKLDNADKQRNSLLLIILMRTKQTRNEAVRTRRAILKKQKNNQVFESRLDPIELTSSRQPL